MAERTAIETPLVSLSAQLGFAPSQIIPVRLAIIFCTCEGYLLIVSSHQVCDSATASGSSNDASAKSRKTSETLLDIDCSQVTEDQCVRLILPLIYGCLLHKNHYRKCGCNTLIAASGITHYRNHLPGHTGITGKAEVYERICECIASHNQPFTVAAA